CALSFYRSARLPVPSTRVALLARLLPARGPPRARHADFREGPPRALLVRTAVSSGPSADEEFRRLALYRSCGLAGCQLPVLAPARTLRPAVGRAPAQFAHRLPRERAAGLSRRVRAARPALGEPAWFSAGGA